MRNIPLFLLLLMAMMLTACGNDGASQQTPTDPSAVLHDVITSMRGIDTFQLEIEQTGAPYPLDISLDGETIVPATIARGTGQFVAPNVLFATVNVDMGLVLTIDIYTRDNLQWVAVPSGSDNWISFPPVSDFNLADFLAENEGLDLALSNLQAVEILGETELIDGSRAIHVRGLTDGDLISDLIFGLIPADAEVQVDLFIDPETNYFSQVEITMLGTETEEVPEPSLWRVEFFDYNGAKNFSVPERLTGEATEEAPDND